jgi:hypothetical protein
VKLKIPTLNGKLKDKHLYIAFAALGALCLLVTLQSPKPIEIVEEKVPKSVDTFIPAGFILIPIDISNAESLDSLIGDIGGVVDLYLASTEQRKGGLKVASKVKLTRAPLNPQQFAVLLREEEGQKLMAVTGPYFAVIQNPETKGSKLSQSSKKAIRIEYQN